MRQPTHEDVLIGRIALASGNLTRDKLDECIHLFENSSSPASLGEIFVQRGYLKKPQLEVLQSIARRDLPKTDSKPPAIAAPPGLTESAFFGRLAIEHGIVKPEQVFECLNEQLQLEKDGTSRQLGDIMVEKGYIKLNDVSKLLRLQKKVVLSCPNCEASFTMTEAQAKAKPACTQCGAPLTEVKRLVTAATETVSVSGASQDALIGKIFSGVQVVQRVGRGGTGTVYKGRHLALNKWMAVKILAVSINDPAMIEKFVKEARASARLDHPNIVQVFNVGRKFGHTFILMQFIDGHTVGEIMDHRKKIPVGQATKIVREIAKALGHAHKQGLVHRDVKPDNVFITSDGDVKVGDFGLALEVKSKLKTDTIAGTPYYMPPEQWEGESQDGRSDIYSLGLTWYYLITGRRAFEGDSAVFLMDQHMHDRPRLPTLVNPEIPRGVSAVIMKMVEKKPEKRYQSIAELLSDIERIESGREPEAPPDASELVQCRFCHHLNPPGTILCTVCREHMIDRTEVLLVDNEFECPKCRAILQTGTRMCESCGLVFCKHCKIAPAVKGTAWCELHQQPPPQFAQRKVRKS